MAERSVILFATLAATIAATAAQAGPAYITNFAKTNNIYTNLNMQYPHTGTGTPGSGVGTPSASYFFQPPAASPAPVTGPGQSLRNDVNNGIGFMLTSDAAGHDFAEVGQALGVDIGVANVSTVYLLMGAYFGTNTNITLTGSAGATQTFSNVFIPDFNGGTVNSVGSGIADQTVFQVYGVGAGGTGNSTNGSTNYYSLTEVGLTLGSQFAGQSLSSLTISGGSVPLLLGVTVQTSDVPEPASWAMMVAGFGLAGAAMRRRKATIHFA